MPNFSQRLLTAGMLLFLLGLFSGLVIAEMPNSRMGLAAHLEGVMNGMFLIAAGLAWKRMSLTTFQEKLVYWLLLYGSYANFALIQSASVLGTSEMTPIAGEGYTGSAMAELLVNTGLVSVALTMITAVILMLVGLVRYRSRD
ncbi:MAG: hydrogenase [Lysobacteraceae bacterium]|nr:MAG: hydrogenase [Xanthomonadaceae bacterium]